MHLLGVEVGSYLAPTNAIEAAFPDSASYQETQKHSEIFELSANIYIKRALD